MSIVTAFPGIEITVVYPFCSLLWHRPSYFPLYWVCVAGWSCLVVSRLHGNDAAVQASCSQTSFAFFLRFIYDSLMAKKKSIRSKYFVQRFHEIFLFWASSSALCLAIENIAPPSPRILLSFATCTYRRIFSCQSKGLMLECKSQS